MKLFVFICITSIVLIACINDKSATTDSKDNSYVKELSEFAYQGDTSSLRKAVDILKKEYGIGDLDRIAHFLTFQLSNLDSLNCIRRIIERQASVS